MATDGKHNAALAFGGVALAAAALALFRKQTAEGGNGTLDQATMELLAAIAAGVGDIDQAMAKLDQIIEALTGGGEGGVTIQGWPANRLGVRARTELLAAANTAYQLPNFPVPSGSTLLVKSYPTNAGLIFVGEDEASVLNPPAAVAGAGGSVWPLLPNEGVGYSVDNVNRIWVSTAAAGYQVSWTVER